MMDAGTIKVSRSDVAWRRFAFSLVFLLVAGTGIFLFADFLWRGNLYGLKYAQLALFVVLFSYLAFGFTLVVFGYLDRRRPDRMIGIDAGLPVDATIVPRTAVLFPIYNEETAAVFAGVQATYQALKETGREEAFDIFVLSDSTDPERWAREEALWFQCIVDLDAEGRIFYRHRRENVDQKAGNITDFLKRWGRNYDCMVIFDADSLMTGECLVRLASLMAENPQVGMIQTVPGLIGGQTPFARAQQFASRLYGPVFAAGLNYWQQGDGNYWGHNAIIRVAPFMQQCELPVLPWREPLGGKILSHDFVEAALMRAAGYEVWLAAGVEGSYEEGPPNAVDAAQRDRRWCQGNLQHVWLLFARRFRWVNRVHLLNGIMSYASAFFWFWFLAVSTLVVIQFSGSGLTLIARAGFMGALGVGLEGHGLVLLAYTAFVLFAPKMLAVMDLTADPERARRFGGVGRAGLGAVTETLFSAAMAPVNMVWHAAYIVMIPLGRRANWNTQNRDAEAGLAVGDAVRVYAWITLLALAWAWLAWTTNREFFYWIAPVLLPLTLSIPVALFAASPRMGRWMRTRRHWITPEELQRPAVARNRDKTEKDLAHVIESARRPFAEMVVTDPRLNAIHLTLELADSPPGADAMGAAEAAMHAAVERGVPALRKVDQRALFQVPDVLARLHRDVSALASTSGGTSSKSAIS